MMKASIFIAYILLLMYFVVGVAFIYLFVLLVRALRKYIKSEPVRKEKAESAKSLGEVIKRYRTQRKMTQEFVAESLGVSRQAVSKWESGTYDLVINGVDITKEREKKFDFSTPYAYDHTVLVVRNDNTTITSLDDLKGKTTANSIGSTYMELGEDYGATVKGVDDLTKCMDLVKSGGVDATINAATSINDYLQTTKDSSFKIVDQSKESTPYAIPMVKGDDNASLKKAVNKALKELKEDGTLSKISIKYFGEDLTKEG